MTNPMDHLQPEHSVRGALPTGAKGQLKVSNWVIATVPTMQAAEACAQALQDAGFADDDVLVESSDTALRQLQADEEGKRHGGLLYRLTTAFEDALAEEPVHAMREQYIADAQAGHVFVGAHDGQGNQIDFIRNMFVEQGASNVYHFEPLAITRLG